MNFIQFIGHKNTNDTFLKKVKAISNTPQKLLENLASLNIFENCTSERNKVSLSELTNTFKMKMSSKGTKSVYSNFPNIFGNGESFTLNFQGLTDFTAQLGKPIIVNRNIIHTKVTAVVDTKKINDKKVDTKRLELAAKLADFTVKTGVERIQLFNTFYTQFVYKILGFKIDTKIGAIKTEKQNPFCRFTMSRQLGLRGENTFVEATVKAGKIFGKTTLFEKFYLGETLRGYQKESIGPVNQNKKVGGNSFVELKSRVGVYIKKVELFAFGDVSVNTAKGLRECGEILAEFGDNMCIGKSIGIGCGMKNRKGPSFIFALPLTTNPEAETYSFGFDYEF